MPSETQSRIIQVPPGEITKDQVVQWLPEQVTRNGGLRLMLAEMIWLRYCSPYPISYEILGHKYGVSRARIHQVVVQALRAMADETSVQIPPGTRLARAVERQRQKTAA